MVYFTCSFLSLLFLFVVCCSALSLVAFDMAPRKTAVGEDPLHQSTVKELQGMCRFHGLPVGGNKTELVKRIRDLETESNEQTQALDEPPASKASALPPRAVGHRATSHSSPPDAPTRSSSKESRTGMIACFSSFITFVVAYAFLQSQARSEQEEAKTQVPAAPAAAPAAAPPAAVVPALSPGSPGLHRQLPKPLVRSYRGAECLLLAAVLIVDLLFVLCLQLRLEASKRQFPCQREYHPS